jgi:pyridoxamine--pyruvate transaminase
MRYATTRRPVLTLTTGPVDAYPEVLQALATTVLYDFDPAFLAHYEKVARKAQRAMGTGGVPTILHGEPVLALEAAAASLIAAGDTVLNLVSGVYGKGFGHWAKRWCRELVEITVPYDDVIDPEAVAAMFRERPDIAVVSVVHHETPSGTINPVDEIGAICARHGAHLIVDAVSSWGGMPASPDACQAAIYVTGPSKCLGCPPGLSLVAVSERGWAKMAANPKAPRASLLSILDWQEAWRADRPFPFTPSVAEINGLDRALDLYLEEGPEAVWERHALTAAACRAGVRGLGLDIWPARDAIASPTTTAVKVPDGIDGAALLATSRERYGVTFSAGRAETLGKLIRIGHMGPTAQPIHSIAAVAALGAALQAMGGRADIGGGTEAAMEIINGAF